MQKNKTLNWRASALFLVLLLFFELMVSVFGIRASAEDKPLSYDDTPIEADILETERSKYPKNSLGECEVIGFMEYCYSERETCKPFYGLYVYVYNPTEKPLVLREGANEIQISTSFNEEGTQNKVDDLSLKYLDNTDNHRFYKFKVTDSSSQYEIAKEYASRWNGRRRYEITAINVMFEGTTNTKTNGVAKIYEFSGYGAGCGESENSFSTLESRCYGGQSVHLTVYHTNYRSSVEKREDVYDDLQSVYFALPNEYVARWGDLSKITAEWYQYVTSLMFVTEDDGAYSELFEWRNSRICSVGGHEWCGTDVHMGPWPRILEWRVLWGEERYAVGEHFTQDYYKFHYGFNAEYGKDLFVSNSLYNMAENYYALDTFHWIFHIPGEIDSIDDYKVSRDQVLEYMERYTAAFPQQTKILEKYAENLFQRCDGDGYKSGTFIAGTTSPKELIDTNKKQNFWEEIFGINNTKSMSYAPIATIKEGDLVLSPDDFSEKYLVGKDDAADVIRFAQESYDNDSTPYLLRFSLQEYYSSPARFDYVEQPDREMSDIDGYVAQEFVYLNFDVLSLEFTSEDGAEQTVVGVVADSIDIINGLTPPSDMPIEEEEWWQKLMMVLLLILLVVILSLIGGPLGIVFNILATGLKFIFTLLLSIISLPFKLVGRLLFRSD